MKRSRKNPGSIVTITTKEKGERKAIIYDAQPFLGRKKVLLHIVNDNFEIEYTEHTETGSKIPRTILLKVEDYQYKLMSGDIKIIGKVD